MLRHLSPGGNKALRDSVTSEPNFSNLIVAAKVTRMRNTHVPLSRILPARSRRYRDPRGLWLVPFDQFLEPDQGHPMRLMLPPFAQAADCAYQKPDRHSIY